LHPRGTYPRGIRKISVRAAAWLIARGNKEYKRAGDAGKAAGLSILASPAFSKGEVWTEND